MLRAVEANECNKSRFPRAPCVYRKLVQDKTVELGSAHPMVHVLAVFVRTELWPFWTPGRPPPGQKTRNRKPLLQLEIEKFRNHAFEQNQRGQPAHTHSDPKPGHKLPPAEGDDRKPKRTVRAAPRGCCNEEKKKLGVSNTPYDGSWWVTDGGWWVTDGSWRVTAGGNMQT